MIGRGRVIYLFNETLKQHQRISDEEVGHMSTQSFVDARGLQFVICLFINWRVDVAEPSHLSGRAVALEGVSAYRGIS